MQACTYLNAVTASVLFTLFSFGACGGSQAPATTAAPNEPTASTTPNPETASAATPAAATTSTGDTAAPSSSSAAGAPPAPASSEGPDRSLNDIRAIVQNNRDAFRACYDRSAKAHPGIKGTFMLSFVVNPDGTVKSAHADQTKSQIHASDLETCAVAALKTLKFPPSRKGMETTVNYPFDFNPGGAPAKAGSPSP